MKVLFYCEQFWPYLGGVERLGAQLVPDVQRGGYELTVITSHGELDLPDEARLGGATVLRYPFRKVLSDGKPASILKVRREVERQVLSLAPDLIHMFSIGTGLFFLKEAVWSAGVPVVVTLHNESNLAGSKTKSTVLADTLAAASWVTACSASILKDAQDLAPAIRDRSCVIRNAVDLGGFVPGPVPMNPPRLLCLGRLVPEKGLDTAVSAMRAVHARFPDARLDIAGYGPERDRLEAVVRRYGLDDVVRFLGQVSPDEVPSVIGRASMVLMPSVTEGLPIVAIETALVGRPIVATAVGGLPEIVKHGVTGLMTEPEDLDGFTAAILGLLDAPERAVAMGRAARRHAQAEFGWSAYCDAYCQLYDQVSTGPKPHPKSHSAREIAAEGRP